MAKATLHLWHPLTQMLPNKALFLLKIPTPKNGTQYKWHLTKMTSHNLHCCQESLSDPE